MTAHPFNAALPDGAAPAKSDLRAYVIGRQPTVLFSAAEIQSIDMGTSLIAIVGPTGAVYYYDAADTTSAHNGLTVLVDGAGRRFKASVLLTPRSSVYAGILSMSVSAPPASPAEGDSYIVGASATGAWAGKDLQVATWASGVWKFEVPKAGAFAWVIDIATLKGFNGTLWYTGGNYVHPNHTGDVTSVGDGATAIQPGVVTYAKFQNLPATSLFGNSAGGAGVGGAIAYTSLGLALLQAPDAATARASLGAVIGANVEAWDADLDALAALAGTGFAARIAANSWAQRTLANAAAGLTWTNADGVSGNPMPVFANDLGALEALAGTGFAARTATDTWAQRSLAAPAAGLTIGNADGVAGNPAFALANDLAALEALSGTNTLYYRSGADTWTAVTIGGLLSFSGGTLNVGDAELAALAGLVSAADQLPYFTGSGTAALTTLSSFMRTLIDDADAATARSTLGLVIDTNVQTFNARLADIAGLSYAKGDLLAYNGSNLTRLPVGADGLGLLADSTQATGLKWATVGGAGGTTNITVAQTATKVTVNSSTGSGADIPAADTAKAGVMTVNDRAAFYAFIHSAYGCL